MSRKEYMGYSSFEYTAAERAEVHRAYYGQFVTPALIDYVVWAIGADVINASTDPHMNDIPLRLWDALSTAENRLAIRFSDVGETQTSSVMVCICKEAARQFTEGPLLRIHRHFKEAS